jgi:hypothetical protein
MRCLVALLLLSGVLAPQTPKPEQKGTIHGVVKDTTGAPVAGITVAARMVDQNKDSVVDGFVWLLKPEYRNGVLK